MVRQKPSPAFKLGALFPSSSLILHFDFKNITMQESSIYTGKWTNWSKGPILGSTLTLTQEDATILIAFLSFYVSLVGSRILFIIRLIFHFVLSSPCPNDGLHNQRQAILRNSSSAVDSVTMLARVAWAWRGRAREVWARITPVLLFFMLWFIGLSLAAIFSSQISTAMGHEVLIASPNCGIL